MRLASCVWVIHPKTNKFLILRRALDDYWCPGHWGLPGGRLDPGEEIAASAAREAKEEAGLDVRNLRKTYEHFYEDINMHVTYYVTKDFDDVPVQISHEHCNYAWVTLKELEDYLCTPYLKELSNKYLKEFLPHDL